MPSLFYKATFERRFPLTFLFFEDIGLTSMELGDSPTEDQVDMAIRRSLKRCYPKMKVKAEDVAYVSERLEKEAEHQAKQAEEVGKEEPPRKKKDFASSYADWAAKLQSHEVCLVAANMDYFAAMRLYTEVDKEDVVDMSAQWMKMEWEKIKVGYESVVYGFGGGYKDSGMEDATTVDVATDDNSQGQVISAKTLASVKF